ncbi:hypothetical protein D3C75_672240 [compost metagenome]
MVGGIDLHHIVAASFQPVDLLVCETLGKLCQCFVLTKEMISVVTSIFRRKSLELPVNGFRKGSHQATVRIAGEKPVPIRPPNQFYDIPASPNKQCLQLVNDSPVATHRPI